MCREMSARRPTAKNSARLVGALVACTGLSWHGANGQQITEGGMRFTKRNVDAMSFRSGSVAGLNARGSASVSGGTLNTGAAASDVQSELNPLSESPEGSIELSIAGDPDQWNQVNRLQRSADTTGQHTTNSVVARGNLDENLRVILAQNPKLIETISKANPVNPAEPVTKTQFTEGYEQLRALLESNTTSGVHILSSGSPELPPPTKQLKTAYSGTIQAWRRDQSLAALPQYAQYSSTIGGSTEDNNNAMRVLSLGSVGTTNTSTNFSVVGFSNRLNPNEGKVTSIASFATNNQTVGTIRVPQLINGSAPTLQMIADQYGTTVEQLVLVNNLPSPDIDITGLSITVPADILTVDYYTVQPDATGASIQTPRSLAQRFDISVSWLMDINGWTNSEQALAPGQLVQVPGLAKSCASQPTAPGCRTTALPAAKPLAAELETADYGAYTTTEVTYDCAGQLMAFCSRFLRPFR
jgi:hypothetical protein